MTPEEKAALRAEGEWLVTEWRTNNPERSSEIDRIARENIDKFFQDREILKETDLNAYSSLIANESLGDRDPELRYAREQWKLEILEFQKDAIELENTDWAKRFKEHMKKAEERKSASQIGGL